MTRAIRVRVPLLAAALLIWLPLPAHAQGFFSAGLGVSTGSPAAEGRANFVAGIGYLPPREPIGVEIDTTYAPSFFKNPGTFTENRLATVMGNVIVAPPDRRGRYGRSRRRGGAVRPYLSGGFGLMAEKITGVDPAHSVSNQHLGVNAGLGIMALPQGSFGVRVEIRYFQDLVGKDEGTATGIDFGSFHFWRVGLGAVVTF